MIMQENRSFDSYFGTFPGADGLTFKNGKPTACVPHGKAPCVRAFADHSDINGGGPHSQADALGDIHGGKMDGFADRLLAARADCRFYGDPACSPTSQPDVMGYHTEGDIPNYWQYAKSFVLHDRMFEPNASWSLPAHLFMVSGWSAYCQRPDNPFSCSPNIDFPGFRLGGGAYAWTDLTYLLHKNSISWGYYVVPGTEPDCEDDAALTCAPVKQTPYTFSIWNPLPNFTTVKQDGELGNIASVAKFYTAAKQGNLPAVSWVVPSGDVSEHPPAPVSFGQSFVTSLVNAVMSSPEWDSTAIFVSWDDWGGFYDHVVPPSIDKVGYGLRVPSLVIGPYARAGYVDHQQLSFDAYLKFIEDVFLDGQRLDPKTDGRPDPRPDVRENVPQLGDLANDFDFTRPPRPPMLLPVHPKTTLTGTPKKSPYGPPGFAPGDVDGG